MVIDGLLRKDKGDATLCSILVVIPEWILNVEAKYVKSLEIRKLIEEIESNNAMSSRFTWENAILWYKGRIYLPNLSKFKIQILKENLDSMTTCHVGFFKTYYNVQQSFFSK
jgi:hypothetical protein